MRWAPELWHPRCVQTLWIIVTNDLRTVVRDRHAVAFFMLPLMLYALGIWALAQGLVLAEKTERPRDVPMAFEGPPEVGAALGDDMYELVPGDVAAVQAGDAALAVRADIDGPVWTLNIALNGDGPRAWAQRRALEAQLDDIRSQRTEALTGRPAEAWEPLPVVRVDAGDVGVVSGALGELQRVIWMFLFGIATLGGTAAGLYPAIDAVLGERDRHTLETSLLLPVPRWQLALAKWLTVTLAVGVGMLGHLLGLGLLLIQMAVAVESPLWIWPTVSLGAALLALPALVLAVAAAAAWLMLAVVPTRDFAVAESSTSVAVMLLTMLVMHGWLALIDLHGSVGWLPWSSAIRLVGDLAVDELQVADALRVAVVHGGLVCATIGLCAWSSAREGFVFGAKSASGDDEDALQGEPA